MGKLNNYAGIFSLSVLVLLIYCMIANKNNDEANFLGYSLKRKRK